MHAFQRVGSNESSIFRVPGGTSTTMKPPAVVE